MTPEEQQLDQLYAIAELIEWGGYICIFFACIGLLLAILNRYNR